MVAAVAVVAPACARAATSGFGGGATNPANGVYNDFAFSSNWFGVVSGIIAKDQTAHVVASSIDIAGAPYNPVDPIILLGFWTAAPLPGFGSGRGTLSVESGTLTNVGVVKLGHVKYGVGEYTGTLLIQGGTLVTSGVVHGGTVGTNDLHVTSGTLDLGYGGVNHSVAGDPNVTFEFAGGTIRNLTSARITALSGEGLITNMTGALTLDLESDSLFSGNICGSGGNITKTNRGVLTFAPGGLGTTGTMSLLGLTTTTNITFNFDLTTPSGSNDFIEIGSGGIEVDPGTKIILGTRPMSNGCYRLFGGAMGFSGLTNFSLRTAPPSGYEYTLSTNLEPGYVTLIVDSVGTVIRVR